MLAFSSSTTVAMSVLVRAAAAAAPAVFLVPVATPAMFIAIPLAPVAASWMVRPISLVVAVCNSRWQLGPMQTPPSA